MKNNDSIIVIDGCSADIASTIVKRLAAEGITAVSADRLTDVRTATNAALDTVHKRLRDQVGAGIHFDHQAFRQNKIAEQYVWNKAVDAKRTRKKLDKEYGRRDSAIKEAYKKSLTKKE